MSGNTDRPNVLVVMCDQMKATASHLYGSTFCETPSMARLANEGVRYEQAHTPHPLCVPARISFWTGQYSHSHGARRNETPMPADATHAFDVWREAGYHTGLIGKNHCFQTDEDLAGFDTWCEISHRGLPEGVSTRGMAWFRPVDAIREAHSVRRTMPYQAPRFGYAITEYPLEDYSTGLVAGQTVRFLEAQAQHDDPFALWVSFPDPHTPYEAPAEYAAMFPSETIDIPPWEDDWARAPERNRVLHEMMGVEDDPLEHVYGVLQAYYAMTRFVDDGLGQILDALERLGLREETIVVFCSDHGDFAGEHGMTRKGGLFYDCLTRVPLIVSWPGRVPANVVDDSMVNLIDVVPTLLTLQGMEVPASMQGAPLPTVTDTAPREAIFSEYGAGGPLFTLDDLHMLPATNTLRAYKASLQWREAEGYRTMVRTNDWKYVHDPMGDIDELYDLRNDPWELHNVAGDAENASVIADMQHRLLDWSMTTERRPTPLPSDEYYDVQSMYASSAEFGPSGTERQSTNGE